MSRRVKLRVALAIAVAALLPTTGAASTAIDAYGAMGLRPKDVLSGSVIAARVLPGEAKQLVAVVTYLTGKKDEANAVNVRLEVFDQRGEALSSLYFRDFGRENHGHVARGEVELVDLDGDEVNEIIVTYDNLEEPLIRERRGEVIVREAEGFRTAWSGAMSYDATRAARGLPPERRDRYEREVDVVETLRTRGVTLFLSKTVTAVAGERLPQPQVVRETFPLRASR